MRYAKNPKKMQATPKPSKKSRTESKWRKSQVG